MKKLFALSIILLGAIFLAGCGQRQTSQTRSSTLPPSVQQSAQPVTPTAQAKKFLEKYCQRQNDESNIWECSELYNYPGGPQKFTDDCHAIGYLFDCSGMCASGRCYLLSTRNKTCSGSKDCESGLCKPQDESCATNCVGNCSENFPPNQCSSTKIFKFKAIENGKIINKQAGGALCD